MMKRTKKKMEIIRRGLKRNLEKVKRRLRRELYCLPLTSIVVLLFITLRISLAWLTNCVSKEIKRQK